MRKNYERIFCMNKKILVFGIALIMLCMAAAVVFAVSENEAYTRGYREGYSNARITPQNQDNWQKTSKKATTWLVFFAGLSQEDKRNSDDLQYQFQNGFEDGWDDFRAGNRPAR
jgi:hypothetical protein